MIDTMPNSIRIRVLKPRLPVEPQSFYIPFSHSRGFMACTKEWDCELCAPFPDVTRDTAKGGYYGA